MQVNYWIIKAAKVFKCSILDYLVKLYYKNDIVNKLASNTRNIYLYILRLIYMLSIFPLPLYLDKASYITKNPTYPSLLKSIICAYY